MRQLITRIDESLHTELKARAKAEGRSMNALVTELLGAALTPGDERSKVLTRLDAAGKRVIPRSGGRAPSRDAAIAATRGAGRAASDALAADRASR